MRSVAGIPPGHGPTQPTASPPAMRRPAQGAAVCFHGAMGQSTPPPPPKDLVREGATRARNMAVALGMIVLILTKHFFVKIVWRRVHAVGMALAVIAASWLAKLGGHLAPHLMALEQAARATTNQLWRATLLTLIAVVGPLEATLGRAGAFAAQRSAMLATRSAATAWAAIWPAIVALGAAFGNLIRAGTSSQAFQKAVQKVLQLVEEAEKA